MGQGDKGLGESSASPRAAPTPDLWAPAGLLTLHPPSALLAQSWHLEMLNNNNNNSTSECDALIANLSFSYFISEVLRAVPFLHKTSGCIYIKK